MLSKREIERIRGLLRKGKCVYGLTPSDWEKIEADRVRENVLGLVGVVVLTGALLGGAGYLGRENRARYAGFSEECAQQAEQQGFSPALCEDDCFRDSYFNLQQYHSISDLNLAYRMAVYKCEQNISPGW